MRWIRRQNATKEIEKIWEVEYRIAKRISYKEKFTLPCKIDATDDKDRKK